MDKRFSDILEVIPPSLSIDPHYKILNTILEMRISELDLSKLLIYFLDIVSPSIFPALAWHFHIEGEEGWNFADTEEKQRQLLKESNYLHRIKGTVPAIERLLSILGFRGRVLEWWEANIPHHWFKLQIDLFERGITEEEICRLDRLVKHWKRATCWCLMELFLSSKGTLFIAPIIASGEEFTVYPYTITNITVSGTLCVCIGEYGVDITTIIPGGI